MLTELKPHDTLTWSHSVALLLSESEINTTTINTSKTSVSNSWVAVRSQHRLNIGVSNELLGEICDIIKHLMAGFAIKWETFTNAEPLSESPDTKYKSNNCSHKLNHKHTYNCDFL